MFILCAAAVPAPMQPVPNNLLCATTLCFHVTVVRSWRKEAPTLPRRSCGGAICSLCRTTTPHPGPCSIPTDAAAPSWRDGAGRGTPSLWVARAEKEGGGMCHCMLGRDARYRAVEGCRGGDNRSPAGCGGGSGPPGCALGPAAAPAALPGLPGLGARRSLAGSGRSRDGGGNTNTGGTCGCGGKAGLGGPALHPSPGPA